MTDAPMTLALVFGGRSGEHDVSVVSARSVDRALDRDRYRVVPMAIDRTGRWADADTAARVLETSGDRADQVVRFEGAHAVDPRLLDRNVDVVVPILHGPFGEDGTIQGLLEMLDLPYVGCDSGASALCMDKRMTKRVLAWAGLPTAPWIEVEAGDWRRRVDAVRRDILELGLPVFVKPSRLGSAVGISKVSGPDTLDAAQSAADLGPSPGDRAVAHPPNSGSSRTAAPAVGCRKGRCARLLARLAGSCRSLPANFRRPSTMVSNLMSG